MDNIEICIFFARITEYQIKTLMDLGYPVVYLYIRSFARVVDDEDDNERRHRGRYELLSFSSFSSFLDQTTFELVSQMCARTL